MIEGPAGELLISIPISDVPEKLPQYYGFSKGRHSGSFFLKVGAAIFCAMHITHLCITIAKEVNVHWIEILTITSSDGKFDCIQTVKRV